MAEQKYVIAASSDHGTVLKPDQTAVTFDEQGGIGILMPADKGGSLPLQAVALIAAGMRIAEDEEFCAQLADWLQSRQDD